MAERISTANGSINRHEYVGYWEDPGVPDNHSDGRYLGLTLTYRH